MGPPSPTKTERVLDGAGEARLVQLACSAAPDGQEQRCRCSDKLVELEVVERISRETVRTPQKNELKPWLKDAWCIPETASAESSLEVPIIASKQLTKETR